MNKKEYQDYQINYLQNDEHELLNWEDLKRLHKLKMLKKRINKNQEWIEKNQMVHEEYIRRGKLIRVLKSEEKGVLDDVLILKKRTLPQITIYTKDESSKSLKESINNFQSKTYKGKLLQKREVYYCTVRIKTFISRNQKNIYLGSKEKIEKALNLYFCELSFIRSENDIKNKASIMLMDFFMEYLQIGYENFSSTSYSFQKVILPWLVKNKKG